MSWCFQGRFNLICKAVTRPSKTERGTIISSAAGNTGSFLWTTNKPSLPIEATERYLLTSFTLANFLDGRVPCFRWAWVRRRSWHSDWISNQVDLDVNGNLVILSIISCKGVDLTTESSVSTMTLHIWHLGSTQSGALRLADWRDICGTTEMPNRDLVPAYNWQKWGYTWISREFTPTFFKGLYTSFTVC